jgi:hypothetical protein
MRMALDPAVILEAQGLTPDSWQKQFLVGHHRKVLLCCTRGAGKSRATSALALHTALFTPNSLVLILSRAQRQAGDVLIPDIQCARHGDFPPVSADYTIAGRR